MKENSDLPHYPFLADKKSIEEPTFFELAFSMSGNNVDGLYRYNFSILRDRVVAENMVKISATGTEKMYISRSEQNIEVGKVFKDVEILKERTRKEALFLSVAAQFNSELALSFLEALKSINIVSGITHGQYRQFTIKKFKDDVDYRKKILNYLQRADFCISDGRVEEVDVNAVDIQDGQSGFSAKKRTERGSALFLRHPVYDNKKKKSGFFELIIDGESDGTKKFFYFLGPVIDTLENGKVLFVDEFDNSLHPVLTKFIVDLFESKKINKNNAQLIVTTHDTSLLSNKGDFIRDQFWFTEKDDFGSAKLFSLAEFDIRNDTEFSKKYLEGRFGALPFIHSLKK